MPTRSPGGEGAAVFFSPGGVPIFFDHDSVTAVVSDIADAAT